MDRLACAELPAFPLQLLLQRHPEWSRLPTAVVAEDRPQAKVLWVNNEARRAGVVPGLRYAQALSLASGLRAGIVPPRELEQGADDIAQRLRRFSPDVERYAGEPGVFWLSGAGLATLFHSASGWGQALQATLEESGHASHVAVGFTRFGTYAATKLGRPLTIFRTPEEERRAALRVELVRLGLEPELLALLGKLGVTTLGDYRELPPGGLLLRFGKGALHLHELASGTRWDPLQPQAPLEPLEERLILDEPESDSNRLLFLIKGPLARLLGGLAARHQVLVELMMELRLERGAVQLERLKPAEPTLDDRTLLRLLLLRLEGSPPSSGVQEIRLGATGMAARAEQLALTLERPRRDLRAANQALAQLRAELGDAAICKAILRDGHLPEAQFAWVALSQLPYPHPVLGRAPVLVRRILARPVQRSHHPRPPSCGQEYGAAERLHGPYLVSGGWWRAEIHREYFYMETERGEWLWLYYDRRRDGWYLQGSVE